MPKFGISIYGTVSAMVEVEADNLEDARDKAIENAPQTSFAFAKFDAVDDWQIDRDSHVVDGEWIITGDDSE